MLGVLLSILFAGSASAYWFEVDRYCHYTGATDGTCVVGSPMTFTPRGAPPTTLFDFDSDGSMFDFAPVVRNARSATFTYGMPRGYNVAVLATDGSNSYREASASITDPDGRPDPAFISGTGWSAGGRNTYATRRGARCTVKALFLFDGLRDTRYTGTVAVEYKPRGSNRYRRFRSRKKSIVFPASYDTHFAEVVKSFSLRGTTLRRLRSKRAKFRLTGSSKFTVYGLTVYSKKLRTKRFNPATCRVS